MKPLTNETLIEKALNINRHWWIARAMTTYGVKKAVAELIYEDIQAILEDKAQDVASALQAKEREMTEKIKSKKKYWHIRFEGISDPVISAERKKFNEEVSELINSVLDDLLSNLSK